LIEIIFNLNLDMAPEKDAVKAIEKPAKKKLVGGGSKKRSSSVIKKPAKKASLSVRVVSKKDSRKDSHEEDIVVDREEAVKIESKGEDREFFKRTSKKTEKEEGERKEKETPKKEIKEKAAEKDVKKSPAAQPRSIGLYRKLSLFFIALTVLLLGSIFYFYFVSLTVEVIPKKSAKAIRCRL
jgi:hypothetical protein